MEKGHDITKGSILNAWLIGWLVDWLIIMILIYQPWILIYQPWFKLHWLIGWPSEPHQKKKCWFPDFGDTPIPHKAYWTSQSSTRHHGTSMLDLLTCGTCTATPAPAPVLGRYLTPCVGVFGDFRSGRLGNPKKSREFTMQASLRPAKLFKSPSSGDSIGVSTSCTKLRFLMSTSRVPKLGHVPKIESPRQNAFQKIQWNIGSHF